ncbi:unnamed protein product [Dracunculus medinensis]|uniref:MATH domain-containing protein n=1 Tax=Dracunculus medinensis TaxID=318479 RepID=A0A158Q6B1_DRAME|nr:unnamed protein product [Dracunculus medinensis]
MTDGLAGETIHLVLEGGNNWQAPIQEAFNTKIGPTWSFVVLELYNGVAKFHHFTPCSESTDLWMDCVVLWIVPLTKEGTPMKNKVVKRVVKKSSPEKVLNGTTTPTATKPPAGPKVIRKKAMAFTNISAVNTTNAYPTSAEAKKSTSEKFLKSRESVFHNNGDGSTDSGVSLTDSDNEKSQKTDEKFSDEAKVISNEQRETENVKFVAANVASNLDRRHGNKASTDINGNELSASFTLSLAYCITMHYDIQLGDIRRVHPHWDELCGQILNNGYYELVKKADKLMTDCQRSVHDKRNLHEVLPLLTSVQVHILNPVDVLRPALDEGVCCFPYGDLLDKTFDIINKAEKIMRGENNLFVDWKPIAELARRAQIHFKITMQNSMEERLGEVVRLKAIQQLQRIDSFMIDSTVNKLEKAAHMARDDLEWEIEQLRQQNSQLRRDYRELKKDYMRLEARTEILENKFKTMARLLQ